MTYSKPSSTLSSGRWNERAVVPAYGNSNGGLMMSQTSNRRPRRPDGGAGTSAENHLSIRQQLFLSYRRNEKRREWVRKFALDLKKYLADKLDDYECFFIWWDQFGTGNDPFPPELESEVKKSEAFLMVYSKGYSKSNWCRMEMDIYMNDYKTGKKSKSSVFIIEYDNEARPEPLQKLFVGGYRFWTIHPEEGIPVTLGTPAAKLIGGDEIYAERLERLSYEMALYITRRIAELAEARPRRRAAGGAGHPGSVGPGESGDQGGAG